MVGLGIRDLFLAAEQKTTTEKQKELLQKVTDVVEFSCGLLEGFVCVRSLSM